MRLIYLLLAYAIFTTANAHADYLREPPSCDDWISQFNKNNIWDLGNKNWVAGFLSGMAFGSQKKILRGVSESVVFHAVYSYCKENPDETIDYGAEAFFNELEKCSVIPESAANQGPACKKSD